ncbi:MAG: hypothetical protein ACJ8AH_23910 [Stellaceae bacterium]
MPNGVICGGAADGSNQAGEIVTCQAITTRPDGAGPAASAAASKIRTAAVIDPIHPKRESKPQRRAIKPMFLIKAKPTPNFAVLIVRGNRFVDRLFPPRAQ